MPEASEIVTYVKSRWDTMYSDATNARNRIQGVMRYVEPDDADIERSCSSTQEDIDGNLFDSTAIEANDILAAGSLAYLTPINENWFGMSAPEGFTDDAGIKWYKTCGEIIRQKLSVSNFYLVTHEILRHRGSAGIGAVFCKMRDNGELWFKNFRPGTYCVSENNYGEVDTFAERMQMTHHQASQQFGEDNLAPQVRELLKQENGKRGDEKHWYVHLIFQRPDAWRGRDKDGDFLAEGSSKAYADIYIDDDSKHMCWNGGFEEMPVFVTRWEPASNDVYGRSPAMKALPTIKSLNFDCAMLDAVAELSVYPPMSVPTNAPIPNMTARAVNRYDENRPDAKTEPLYEPTQYNLGLELVNLKREQVRSMFYTDKFSAFSDSTKRMQTFEAMQLADEKLALFHPTMARYYTEFITPMFTKRIFPMMLMAKPALFPPPPASVFEWARVHGDDAVQPMVVYMSKIALAVQAVQMKGTMAVLQILPALQPFDPNCGVRINFDQVLKDSARIMNMPERQIRSDDEVAEMKKAAEEQQNMMAQIQMAQGGAAAAKDAAQAGLLGRTEEA